LIMKRKNSSKQKKILVFSVIGLAVLCASFPLASMAASKNLSSRVAGRILLQVEKKGEAWYVDLKGEKSYLGKPSDAFGLMRKIGVGITDSDIAKIQVGDKNLLSASSTDSDVDGLSDAIETALGTVINSNDTDGDGKDDKTEVLNGYDPNSATNTVSLIDEKFAKKQAGKILLQVQKNGEAWYVYPGDNKRYFLGQASDAYKVMRELGLGILEKDIQKINEKKANQADKTEVSTSTKKIKADNKKPAASSEGRMATGTAPQASIDACNGLASGTDCNFTLDDKAATGTCAEFNGKLSCRPKNLGIQGKNGPGAPGGAMASSSDRMAPLSGNQSNHGFPQEMVNACSGLTSGTSCSFTGPDKNASTGACTKIGNNLVCLDGKNSPAKK
jgi:hypothetical protein